MRVEHAILGYWSGSDRGKGTHDERLPANGRDVDYIRPRAEMALDDQSRVHGELSELKASADVVISD